MGAKGLTLKRLLHRIQPIEHIKVRASRKRDVIHRENLKPERISFESVLKSEMDKLEK